MRRAPYLQQSQIHRQFLVNPVEVAVAGIPQTATGRGHPHAFKPGFGSSAR